MDNHNIVGVSRKNVAIDQRCFTNVSFLVQRYGFVEFILRMFQVVRVTLSNFMSINFMGVNHSKTKPANHRLLEHDFNLIIGFFSRTLRVR
jgi:hypothetical protein